MNRRQFGVAMLTALGGVGLAAAGAAYWPRRWSYIVVHHSAGAFGTVAFLRQVHEERQPLDPVPAMSYHYAIGNGNGLAMGEVASGRRWDWHLWGSHLSGRNFQRNFFSIGICLIGNFEETEIPDKQYQALVRLTRALMERYRIPVEQVSGHGETPGEQTKCPGRHFPMERFRQDIGAEAQE